jgi:hypothetical protein
MTRGIVCAVFLIALLAPSGVSAQWIVHDPISYANHILRYQQLIMEYEMFYYELRGLQNLASFQSPRTILRFLQLADVSANSRDLEAVLNRESTPQQIDAAFDKAITTMRTLRSIVTTAQLDPVQAMRDMLALLDASSKSSAGTIGDIREEEGDYQIALKNLESDTAAAYGIKSTEKSVLQKINSAAMMSVKEQHKTNQALVQLLEQTMLMNQQYREALASAVNDEAYRQENPDDLGRFLQAGVFEPPSYR